MSHSLIGSDDAIVLGKTLVHSKALFSLDLSGNSIGDSGIEAIAEGLKGHTNLQKLRLGTNCISADGMAALVPVIRRNHLQHLDLSGNGFGPEGVDTLVDAMDVSTLQTLDLSHNQLGVDGVASLSIGLQKCKQLQELNVSRNGIGSHSIARLAKGIQHCTNLQFLDLSSNAITSEGVPEILEIMKSCQYLQKLRLNLNRIDMDNAADLVRGWLHTSMLTLELFDCFGRCHELALQSNGRCCSSCDHLLVAYYNNDYLCILLDYTSSLPKLVSANF